MSDFDEKPADASLCLIYPDNLRWRLRHPPHQPECKDIMASFALRGARYALKVTDPSWYDRLTHVPEGEYPQDAGVIDPNDRVLLTVSLGEPFGPERKCYKVIAAVIVVPKELHG